ncbi:MAG: FecR domain-containing protein [Fibrobacter sp.]|nr:FecR domain-containing protein [Fibrobacter sp.]
MNRFVFFLSLFAVLALTACKDEKAPEPAPKDVAVSAPVEEAVPENALLKAKVRSVVGTVEREKADSWTQLRVGKTVVENDHVRTALESELIVNMTDGSALRVPESSNVTFQAELQDNVKKLIFLDIHSGKVHFDIQKQQQSEIYFKTGTATVAIRGTAGFVGEVQGKTVASLKEGKVEVSTPKGKATTIVKNQTVLVDDQGDSKVLKLESSGTEALAAAIDSIAKAEDGGAALNTEILEKSMNTFDKSYGERQRNFEKNLQFKAVGIPDSLYVPSVMLQARITPGTIVTVWGERDTVPESGIYQKTLTWGDSAYGTKRFLVGCSDGDVELPCYMWVTEYVPMPALGEAEPAADTAAAKPVETKPADDVVANLKLSVKIGGGRNERVHLDLPATELSTNLKFNLAGITAGDLGQLKSLVVLRNGKPFKSFAAGDLTTLAYEVPVSIERNKIADFEVVATLKNGKNFRAKKTYEVYCMVANHPGGKARNSIVPPDQEYERLKQSGELKHE